MDIDLFSNFGFDVVLILENISQDFPFQLFYSSTNTLRGSIGNIKTDIIAMKLNAIITSGQRIKDFIDIYFFLDKYDIADMVRFYKTKYNQENDGLILKSLIYFEDVDNSDWPILIKNPGLKWGGIKKRIEDVVIRYVKR